MSAAFDLNALHHDSAIDLLDRLNNATGLELEHLVSECLHSLPELQAAMILAGCDEDGVERLINRVDELANDLNHSGFREDNEWPPLDSFDRTEGSPFPLDTLPPSLRTFCEDLAEATQTPIDLAAMLSLAAIATAVQRKFEVHVREDYFEPLNIYVLAALPPAARKSAVVHKFEKVFRKHQRAKNEATLAERIETKNLISALKKRNDKLQHKAAKEEDEAVRGKLLQESKELAGEIFEREQKAPKELRVIASDVTAERLAELMSENDERMALWTAEGGTVTEMIRGRYTSNNRGNQEIWLMGHAGDGVSVDRKSDKNSIDMEHPAITMGLAVQPSVVRGLKDAPELRDRGLLGRILYCFPRNLIGSRNVRVEASTRDSWRGFSDTILQLLNSEGDRSPIELSPEALEIWLQFSERIELELGEGGNLEQIPDWGGKLCGAVARIAGLLHCAEVLVYLSGKPISAETMTKAVHIGEYLIDHALVAFSLIASHDSDPAARKLLRRINRMDVETFHQRDIHQAVKNGASPNTATTLAGLENLERRGHVRRVDRDAPQTRKGRKRSPLWEVRPKSA